MLESYYKEFYIEYFKKNGKDEVDAEIALRKRYELSHMTSRRLIRTW